jgi:hypothetical protein
MFTCSAFQTPVRVTFHLVYYLELCTWISAHCLTLWRPPHTARHRCGDLHTLPGTDGPADTGTALRTGASGSLTDQNS